MRYGLVVASVLVSAAAFAASKPVAPPSITHESAMLLTYLSDDGKNRVAFRAAARGTHFFIEEAAGVTVYEFDGSGYRMVTFIKKSTLAKAMEKYPK